MMKKSLLLLFAGVLVQSLRAQAPIRPDAFPPIPDTVSAKGVLMADSLSEMADWKHYPTYELYVQMMQKFAADYPQLCILDTIGYSVNNRLILCAYISSDTSSHRPQFFYSSTMHGDELAGFHFMLHLIDTLLESYNVSPALTDLINTTDIFINPLANPDGTYYGGNHTVFFSRRNNANDVDLNRNYPDPFSQPVKQILQPENSAMIDYVERHQFKLSANLHGGSEVMNYPWDSFNSYQRQHPNADWWIAVCQRFVDSCRTKEPSMFDDVCYSGVIAGGDWYVIRNGRQDYMNYYHDLLEVTMELSAIKKLSVAQLPVYWNAQAQSLINYIGEIHSLPTTSEIRSTTSCPSISVFPNPTNGRVSVIVNGRTTIMDLSGYRSGLHLFSVDGFPVRIIKL